MERKHGKKKRYVKLHFAVNVETKEIVAMEVSTDDVHDVKAFPGLVKEANEKRWIACWLGDGAYDSGDVFEELEERGIEAVVSLGGTVCRVPGHLRGGGWCGSFRSWVMRVGRWRRVTAGGGLWRLRFRRLSGCLGGTA